MFRAFFKNRKWAPWAYGGGLILLILLCAQAYCAYLSVLINSELFGMFDEGTKVTSEYYDNVIWRFLLITLKLMGLQFVKEFVQKMYALRWRHAITYFYLPLWRLFDVDLSNVNQRIQEDPFEFARRAVDMLIIGFDSIIKLAVFIPVLWSFGRIATWNNQFAGALFWLLFAYCLLDTVISYLLGRSLEKFQYNKRDVEANFQAQLILAEKSNKSLYTQPEDIDPLFDKINKLYWKLFLVEALHNFFKSWHNQAAVLFFLFIVKGDFISGIIALGLLKKMIDTMDQVKIHLSFFIDHWQALMELKAVFRRIYELDIEFKEKQSIELAN